ncbi:MAG: heavy metal-binding domain-containing protein [Candidatus Hydrogenedentota bacterium]
MKNGLFVMAIASAILVSACGGSTQPPAPTPEAVVAPAPASQPEPAAATDTASMMSDTKPAVSGMKYTCPMHPEVMMDDPKAKCPKCGMNLVPAKPSAGGAPATSPAKDIKMACTCAKDEPDCTCEHCSTGKGECSCGSMHHAS